MSDEKNKVSDMARNIWLAGVGAYGRAVDEAQGRLEKAGVETPKLFRDLVKAGTALEEEARSAGDQARNSVEERIARVRENFRLQRHGDDLAALHEKIDRLSEQVAALSTALANTPQRKAPAKKAARKTAAKKASTTKTPAKKAPAKKATAKKAPAKKAPAKKRPGRKP
ncbi:phasin family protein [Parahaliea mediterranea]|uniref:phasin family protein n=1 Tax=Parahaliea mediterranea TaxID=651086 RepID=UPI000E2E4A71|nr:phasin family protein [Parahaliea mediterranea]